MLMKLKILCLLFFVTVIFSCKKDSIDPPAIKPTEKQQEIISYFLEIAMGSEFDQLEEVTRKWKKPMTIYVSGSKDTTLLIELNTVISEINELATDNFKVILTSDSAHANYQLFLGTGSEYAGRYSSNLKWIEQNFGLFTISTQNHEIIWGTMYVDIRRAATLIEQKHLLREELTQSLGLLRDSYRYANSIFQQSYETKVTQYSEIDKVLIKLLYHPKITPGLNHSQVIPILTDILNREFHIN